MLKKIVAIALACSCLFLTPMQSYAEEEPDQSNQGVDEVVTSIGLIDAFSAEVSVGTKLIHMKICTYGSGTMDEIGFKDIQIQRYTGSGWYTEKSIASVITTNACSYCLGDYTASVLGGYYYRIVLNHYAKDGSTIERSGNTSNSVWIA